MNYAIIAIVALLFTGSMPKLPSFKKDPPVAAASEADKKAVETAQKLTDTQQKLDAANAKIADQTKQQIGYAQVMVEGADHVANQAKDKTPEIAAIASFTGRAKLALALANSPLTPQQQADVWKIAEDLASGERARADAAEAQLHQKDTQLQVVTAQKNDLAQQVPGLTKERNDARTDAKTSLDSAVQLNGQVQQYAAKQVEKDKKLSSAEYWESWLGRILVIGGIAYLLVHVLLPNLAQSYPGVSWLTKTADFAKNISTSHV